jgi:hypothetical protein
MSGGTPALAAGLRLPAGLVQPFWLRLQRDDLHVMAFFTGHPLYEAVEAMIQARPDGSHSIRAIVTRHDQSQIDHVNDDALLARMRGARREIHRRDIRLESRAQGQRREAQLRFTSGAGEQIELFVATARPPDTRGAGLSDPGGHSATSSLPMMWRAASTFAGPDTHVTIDAVRYPVRLRRQSGAIGGYDGYYTEGHNMGVMRAGTVSTRLVAGPALFDVGGGWTVERDGSPIDYRIVEREASGRLRIETRGAPDETIFAFELEGCLIVERVSTGAQEGSTEGLCLSLGDGAFEIGLDGASGTVGGQLEYRDTSTGCMLWLRPQWPDWAVGRPVRLECARSGDTWTVTTTVGQA